MKMPKSLSLVAILLAGSLAACSGQREPEPTTSPIVTPAETVASPLPTPTEATGDSPRIMFKSDRDGAVGWYTMNSDGSDVEALEFQIDGEISTIRWIPPLHSFIAIANLDGQFDLYLLDQEGVIKTRLTSTPDDEGWPTYSDAAQAFAFPCVQSDLDICTVPASGGEMTNLTGYPSREDAPDWSPSGEEVVFVSNRDAVPDIWKALKDGSALTNLSQTGQPDTAPSWSPDGKRILFTSQRDQNWEVYTMGPDGENPVNLTNNPASDVAPEWSPDGTHIAFRSDRTGDEEIYSMKADGTDLVNITTLPNSDECVFTWSLDGESILYISEAQGDADIYSVGRDGGNMKNLTNSPFDDFAPQWIYQ